MSSRIPTASSLRKPAPQPVSRLPVPQTAIKRPQAPMQIASRLPLSRSAFKRPASVQIGSEVTKKRMTPISLLKSSTANSGLAFPRAQNPMQAKELAAALNNLPESNFRTPVCQKENTCFNESYEKIVRSSPITIPPYSPVKKVTTTEKEINTDIEWATFNREAEISFYKSQIGDIQKSLTEAQFRENELKNEKEFSRLQIEKLELELERTKKEVEIAKLETARQIQQKDTAAQEQHSKLLNDVLVLQEKLLQESKAKGEAQAQMNILESEVSLLRNQLEKANAESELKDLSLEKIKMKEEMNKQNENELKLAKQQLEDLQTQIEQMKEKEKLSQIFSNELKDLKVMEEEKHCLKIKLESLQESCNEMELLKVQLGLKNDENALLKEELEMAQKSVEELSYAQIQLKSWETELQSTSPGEFKMETENIKQNNILLTNDNELLKNTVNLLKEQIQCHEEQFNKLNDDLQNAQLKVDQQEAKIHEFEEKTALLEKKNDLLNEKFEEISSQKAEVKEQLSQQIDQLQNDAKNLKIIVTNKDEEMFGLKNQKTSLENLVQERTAMINQLQDQVHSLEAKIEDIKAEHSQSQQQDSDVRVVTFNEFNPYLTAVQEREKRFKELIEENTRLSSLVEVLQSDEEKANMTIQMNNVIDKNSQIAKLEVEKEKCRKILEKERQNNHEVIRKLRSHYSDLTGFKMYMDRLHQNVTLKHCLDERFKLRFSFLPDSLIELGDLSGLKCCPRAKEFMKKYLEDSSCFPAFLAALTLELFEQRL